MLNLRQDLKNDLALGAHNEEEGPIICHSTQ